MGLIDRINRSLAKPEERATIDTWLTDYMLPANQYVYNGYTYGFADATTANAGGVNQTYNTGNKVREISNTLPAYAGAMKRCPPAFAAETVRASVLSQAKFTFRNRRGTPTARRIWSNNELSILEKPWPGATTGDLIARMEWHAGLAGNSYVLRQNPLPNPNNRNPQPRLRVLRPDWVGILYGSDMDPDDPMLALDSEVIGYIYVNGGFTRIDGKPQLILPENIAHWYPLPDPECANMGMSWITPALREMQSDNAASEHKLHFFTNAATPNMVIKGLPAQNKKLFDQIVDTLEERHTGIANAYRTLYLTAGADATVVGSNFQQMTFSDVVGAGETRITALSRVPAIMIGLSEGLKGAALNAGNFGQVRRMFADTWVFPQLQNLAASLEPILKIPDDSELWFDVQDMPILREDATDAATIVQMNASTIGGLVRDGFTPESATQAVLTGDMTLLKAIPGWISVQLQNMAGAVPPAGGNSNDPSVNSKQNGGKGKPVPTPPKGSDQNGSSDS